MTHAITATILLVAVGCTSADLQPIPLYRGGNQPALATTATTSTSDTATHPIDLTVALRLAGVSNPTIALAQERIQEALAGQTAARSLLLPSVNVGANYRHHHGVLQNSSGAIQDVISHSTAAGFGVGAIGSGSPAAPGLRIFANLGDAAYEPLAAQQRFNAVQSDAQAVQNAILRDVAIAYLELVGAEGRQEILRKGEHELAEVVRLTEIYAEKGQGRAADANRAKANADLLARSRHQAEEELGVAAARLSRLLNLDPSVRLATPGGAVEQLKLKSCDNLDALIAQAVKSRPEVIARSAEILEARTRVQQERVRPWLPTLSAGFSSLGFGGDGNRPPQDHRPFESRMDFDVAVVWSFQNLGRGNHSRVLQARSVVGQTVNELDSTINRIRTEVASAFAEIQATTQQVEISSRAVQVAEEGYRLEKDRIRQGQGLPIETLDSFRQLLDAQQVYLRSVIDNNIAQFKLQASLGFSASQ